MDYFNYVTYPLTFETFPPNELPDPERDSRLFGIHLQFQKSSQYLQVTTDFCCKQILGVDNFVAAKQHGIIMKSIADGANANCKAFSKLDKINSKTEEVRNANSSASFYVDRIVNVMQNLIDEHETHFPRSRV